MSPEHRQDRHELMKAWRFRVIIVLRKMTELLRPFDDYSVSIRPITERKF